MFGFLASSFILLVSMSSSLTSVPLSKWSSVNSFPRLDFILLSLKCSSSCCWVFLDGMFSQSFNSTLLRSRLPRVFYLELLNVLMLGFLTFFYYNVLALVARSFFDVMFPRLGFNLLTILAKWTLLGNSLCFDVGWLF